MANLENDAAKVNSPLAFGPSTATALEEEVELAKRRGWLKEDLARFFRRKGIDANLYRASLRGEDLQTSEQRAFLTQLSITGLPDAPQTPKARDISAHIEWLIEPAIGAFDDALIEIAFDNPGHGPTSARLFGLDEVNQAVEFALSQNLKRSNVYVGAALRLPDTPRGRRCSSEDFYVATAVPIDIDKDYDDTRARMATVCQDGLIVSTGMTPERRSQHWARLLEPCDNDLEFGMAFAGLVNFTGADMAVKDSARIMRLGGTVSFPNERKIGLGYCTELTTVTVRKDALPVALEVLKAHADDVVAGSKIDRPSSAFGIIEYGGKFGATVINGREVWWRNIVLKHLARFQDMHGADPTAQEIWELAFPEFERTTDNTDERWTSPPGQKELRNRISNTIRRLRAGRLITKGLYSIETGVGKEDAQASSSFEPEDFEDPPFRASTLHGDAPERQWIVPDWIVQGSVNSLYGDGGLGKTLLAQQLAYSVSLGIPWLGLPTAKGSVLAILCEDDKGELHRRHNDIKKAMGHAIGNPFDDVWLWPRVGSENILLNWDTEAKVGKFAASLERTINELRPSFLILDTLADFYGANEIDRVQVNYFVKTMLGGLIKRSSWPLTILLLGHPSVRGKESEDGFSGSTAWNNAVRSRIYLTKPKDGDSNDRLLTRGKANYAASGEETGLKLTYDEGVLRALEHFDQADEVFWACVRHIVDEVRNAWDFDRPLMAAKTHDRNIHRVLLGKIVAPPYTRDMVRNAITTAIDDGQVQLVNRHGKRGYATSIKGLST